MNQQNKTALLMTVLTLGLYFSGIFVFLTPLPYIYYYLKFQNTDIYSTAWPSLFIVILIYLFGIDFFHGLYQKYPATIWLFPVPVVELIQYFSHATVQTIGITYFAVYLVIGFLIAKALRVSKDRAFKIFFVSVCAIFLATGFLLLVFIYPQSDLFLPAYRQYMESGMQQFIAAQEKAGIALDQIVYFKSQIPTFIDYALYLMPFILLVSLTIIFVLNLVIAKRFFVLADKNLKKINLSEFKLPFYLVWFVVGLSLVLVINEKLIGNQALYYLILNILLSLGVAYFLQGFASFIHFLNRRKIYGLFRFFAFILMIFMMQASVLVLTILGFVDNWLDLRKLDYKGTGIQNPGSQA